MCLLYFYSACFLFSLWCEPSTQTELISSCTLPFPQHNLWDNFTFFFVLHFSSRSFHSVPIFHGALLRKWSKKFNFFFFLRYWIWWKGEECEDGGSEYVFSVAWRLGFSVLYLAVEVIDWGIQKSRFKVSFIPWSQVFTFRWTASFKCRCRALEIPQNIFSRVPLFAQFIIAIATYSHSIFTAPHLNHSYIYQQKINKMRTIKKQNFIKHICRRRFMTSKFFGSGKKLSPIYQPERKSFR